MTDVQALRSRYALNLPLSLSELQAAERFELAARFGFDQVELWWPYATPDPGVEEIAELRGALRANDLQLVCLNNDAGDRAAGDRGLLSDPARRDRCRASILAAVETAAATGCRLLNLPYGNRIPGVTAAEQHDTAWDNLRFAAGHARAAGVTVLVEPLNSAENPGYLLPDLATAAELAVRLRRVGEENVGILLDVYHLARTAQDVEGEIARHAEHVRHVQFADLPDRRCPGTGELEFGRIHEALAAAGYRGYFGLEFTSAQPPDRALHDALAFVTKHPARLRF